jgi:uncharacterized membrane protein
MTGSWIRQSVWVLTLAALLGSGIMGGVFFAFSNFIMKALGMVAADRGITAMQSINVTVINPLFMLILFGTAAACIPLAIFAFSAMSGPGATWLLAGCALYLVGSILVTALFNVPLNNTLAGISADSGGAEFWLKYLKEWTAWNHVRTLASVLASIAFAIALCRLSHAA